jgi:DNA topoisomerase-1
LGFGTNKTMSLAQQLYEGIELGAEGTVGLITYMRTDSTNISSQAQNEARGYIIKTYGPELAPEKPPVYKTKSKAAQEAHEGIRPTSVWREPDKVKAYLSREQLRLYTLIWQRFVSSQMEQAIYDTMSVTIGAGSARPGNGQWPYRFQASGSRIRFKGFLTVYEESRDEDASPDEDEAVILPELTEGEMVDLVKLWPNQHFTQPPPRYTEATLVRTLEEYGIGRPSTYAPIISTIQQRGYVEKSEKRLYPTELGEIVNELLVEYFPDIVNVQFTAQMEEDLDRIAEGEEEWVEILREFYRPFSKAVTYAETHMPEVEVADEPTGEMCEKCGHPMVLKFGRFGKFEACSNFPECQNAKPHLVKLGIACPNDGGELVERRTKKGRVFYGCANYPECEWSSWKKPLPIPCPNCQGLLVEKNRQWASCLNCEEQFAIEQLSAVKTTDPELAVA